MPCDFFHVDAFAAKPLSGNPAAVCLLPEPADTAWMQRVAAEMNLSETAFVAPHVSGGFGLRWFTPRVEVDLCGHATLASAHALWESGRAEAREPILFQTRSGTLSCRAQDDWIVMDFPSQAPLACDPPPRLLESLGVAAHYVGRSRMDYLVHVATEDIVRALKPDFRALSAVDVRGIIVTAASDGSEFDFVSRFFAPAVGVDEDPVTGSAHCCLCPYWSSILGRRELMGFQASAQGGVVRVTDRGERVSLGGQAVTIVRGQIILEHEPAPILVPS